MINNFPLQTLKRIYLLDNNLSTIYLSAYRFFAIYHLQQSLLIITLLKTDIKFTK